MAYTSVYLCTLFAFFCVASSFGQAVTPTLISLNDCPPNPPLVFLFAHGVGMSSKTCSRQAKLYLDSSIITSPCFTFDFGDGLRTINLGQDNDCALFISAYNQLRVLKPQAQLILVGISRGAVTILNSIALHPEIDWSPVKAALLESPYADVTALAEQIASSYMFFIPFNKALMRKLINTLPSYKPLGMQPIKMIEHIKPLFPLFIAYSEIDKTVPASGTQLLISKLESTGHKVTTWSTKKGKHSKLGLDSLFSQAARDFLTKHLQH